MKKIMNKSEENARSNILKIELMVLQLLTQRDFYSYEFAKTVERLSDGQVKFKLGTLYPLLYKLEDEGYVSSYKEEDNRSISRVYYHIEEKGYAYLEKLTKDYFLTHDAIQKILEYKE